MKGSALRFAVAYVAASVFAASAMGAPVAPPPPPVTPGQVKSTLPTQGPVPSQGPAQVTNTAPNPEGVAPGGASVLVKGFDIHGNTVIPTSELQQQIAGYVGKTLTLSELYDVADILTRYYRAKGYGLADVSLPAQTLQGGTVRMQVIEGRLGKIGIQGNNHTRDAVLQKRLAGLNSGDVYEDAPAERAVLLLNDLPGVGARAVLSPGQEFGTSDLLFNVDETRFTGDASVDDYGRSVIGRWRVSADANINSLTGSGDQLGAGITHADGNLLNFGKLFYALPVGAPGGTLTTSYNRAEYRGIFVTPGSTTGVGVPFSGSTDNAAVVWQYPEIRSSNRNLTWSGGVTWDDSNSLTATTRTNTSKLFLLQLTGLYTHQYEDQSSFSMSGSFWTNGKHYAHDVANPLAINQEDERGRAEVDTSWQKPFADVWDFVGQLNLSYSVNALTDADKYNLGGPGSVLGYQSAEQRGDSGYFLSGEVQRSFALSPNWPMVWGAFLDTGKVWSKAGTVGACQLSTDSSCGLSSGGLDLQLLPATNKINARLQWAYAIGRRPEDGNGGGHIWFSVGMTF